MTRIFRTHRRLSLFPGLLLLVSTACSGDNALGPANQLEVTNVTDNFQLQATSLENVSQTLSYTWNNTGTMANIDQSGVLSSGSATLTIRDGAGVQMYAVSLGETGTFATDEGTAGSWSIRVQLSGASGALNFRAQKP